MLTNVLDAPIPELAMRENIYLSQDLFNGWSLLIINSILKRLYRGE